MRRLYREDGGFTLLELLLAVAVAGAMLASAGAMLHVLCSIPNSDHSQAPGESSVLQKSLGVIAADARGVTAILPAKDENDACDRCIARFRGTNVVRSVSGGLWNGQAEVSYWLRQEEGSRVGLWRSESLGEAKTGENSSYRLTGGLTDVTCQLLINGEGTPWPASEEELQKVSGEVYLEIAFQKQTDLRGESPSSTLLVFPVIACPTGSKGGGL